MMRQQSRKSGLSGSLREKAAFTVPQMVARIWRRSPPPAEPVVEANRADETYLGYEASWLQWHGPRDSADAAKNAGTTVPMRLLIT